MKHGVLVKITTYIYDGTTDEVGSLSILMYTNKKQAYIFMTIKNMILEFKNVDWNIAALEGEHNNLREWQDEHLALEEGTIDIKHVLELLEEHCPNAIWNIESHLDTITDSINTLKKLGYLDKE